MKQWVIKQLKALRRDWLKVLIIGVSGLIVVSVTTQLLYPTDRLALFAVIDGEDMSGWVKADAVYHLDDSYRNLEIPIYFGSNSNPYRSPKASQIGLTATNTDRINKIDYPWYLRIIPSSILWVHLITDNTDEPNISRDNDTLNAYITKELNESCDVKPQDASLKPGDSGLEVVASTVGGTCDIETVGQKISQVIPKLGQDNRVIVPIDEVAPKVSNDDAKKLGDSLNAKAGTDIPLKVNSETVQIPAREVFSWMDFKTVGGKIDFSLNADRAGKYLNDKIAPKVTVTAGTTTVSTYNFTETSRVNGVSGRTLGLSGTLDSIKAFLEGQVTQPSITTVTVAPKIVYKRSYSPTDVGLSALMKQYGETHAGVYGVSIIELGGKNRRASYNDNRIFTTASTYKLFVAYSTLKRIEAGKWHWTDQINGGRDLAKCFDDMIVKSDNECAKALLLKIGFQTITNEAHSIGATHTSFMGNDGIKTTPADLATVLAQLQTGQILNQQSSRTTWINAMKRNVYRQGIPKGINATVADKVGFLDGLLHDAAIVYSPTGTYVLIIMTDGSSWGNIADLTSKIEALRNQ